MHLNDRNKTEQDKYMAKRLEMVKPLVKTRCPESFIFYNTTFRKAVPQYTLRNFYF
jgi:hypothetical protein